MNESFILDALPDAIIWVHPVRRADGNIEDFEISYSNKPADEGIRHPKGCLKGLRILGDGVPSAESAAANFAHFLEVYQSGEVRDFTFYAHHAGRYFDTHRKPLQGGVLSATRDREALHEARQKEERASRALESIVAHSPIGILVYEAVRDESGAITDFRNRHYNDRSNELTGYSDRERQELSFRQVLEGLQAGPFFDRYKDVVQTGVPYQREQYIAKRDKWITSSIVKFEDGFLAMLTDVTELKTSQHALQHQSDYLAGILNASLNAVVTMEAVRDENGWIRDVRYTQVNRQFLEWFSKKEEEVIGQTMLQLFPATERAGIMEVYRQVLTTGASQRAEFRYQDGVVDVWLDISVARLSPETIVSTFSDITERKHALEHIEQQKNLLDNILRHSSNGISVSEAIRDDQGRVVDARTLQANDAAVRYTGLPRELYLSKTAVELDPNILNSTYFQQCVRTLDTGEPFILQYFLEGTGKWLELTVSKMDDHHLIHIFTDVTSIKEAQLQLERTVEELRRSNASLEEFAYAASHDLQEPLRKIYTFSDRLLMELNGQLNPGQQRMFDRMQSATTRMRALIDDLLAYSQVSAQANAFEPVELGAVVQQVVHDLEAVIAETGAKVQVGELPQVSGDERQLRQMFHNLIGNALKYHQPGVAPEVSVTSRPVSDAEGTLQPASVGARGAYHLIEVRDNGIGFEQQYAEKIFQVFHRLHGRAEYEGTGVGLAIVQKVVVNHKGYIRALSEPGNGATFQVLLPK